jgi:L-cysteine desulfidase
MENLIAYLVTEELKPAVGCTEPISVAFTAAVAGRQLRGLQDEIEQVSVELDKNVFKNGKDVSIPSPFPLRGNLYAAPIGALLADPDRGLQILQHLPEAVCHQAQALVEQGKVKLTLNEQATELYVKVTLTGRAGNVVTAISQRRHDQVVFLQRNAEILLDRPPDEGTGSQRHRLAEVSFTDFFAFLETCALPAWIAEKLDESIAMNRRVMEEGLRGVGTGLGKKIIELGRSECAMNYIISHCAAAVDARMAGVSLPVMSVTGSGNQGLILFLTIDLYASQHHFPRERLHKAIVLGIFLAGKIKHYSGRLSALCGCVIAAGIAGASALAYLEGQSREQVVSAFNIMASDIMGIVCDGAKSSCALKAATGVNSLLRSVKLSRSDFSIPPLYGIIGQTIDETCVNIGKISNPGMLTTDQEILKIMTSKDSQLC